MKNRIIKGDIIIPIQIEENNKGEYNVIDKERIYIDSSRIKRQVFTTLDMCQYHEYMKQAPGQRVKRLVENILDIKE